MDDRPEIAVRRVFSRSKKMVVTTDDVEGDAIQPPLLTPEAKDAGNEEEPPMIDVEDDFLADMKMPLLSRSPPPTPPPTPQEEKTFDMEAAMNNPLLAHLRPPGSAESEKPAPKKKGGGGRKKKEVVATDGFEDLYGTPSPILGADKRQLLVRIQQYKSLFPDNNDVKKFKVKNNPSVEDLEQAIQELDSIVSCSTLQTMVDEMILTAVRVVEGVSSRTNSYDITGTADMLKHNDQFYALARVLTIKHGVFARVPPEYQMLMLIFSTAMVARSVNSRRKDVENLLNQHI